MTTAYITCFNGRLTAESTLIIDGCEYPIPATTDVGNFAPLRIDEAVHAAGYTYAGGDYHDALSNIDDNGGYTIELVKL